MGMRPAVFLDRDNTIIHNDGDLGDPKRVVLMKGVAPAIASLRGLGFRVVIVTNQGGVARGRYTEEDVHAVHDRIAHLVERQANGASIDAFYYCPYHPGGTVEKYRREHPSRKPAPGMLLQAAEDLKLDLNASWMVGDQMRDVEAGRAAGTRTILLLDATQSPPRAGEEAGPDYDAMDLVEAVRIIAQLRTPEPMEDGSRVRKPGEPRRRRWDAKRVAEVQTPRPARDDRAGGPGDLVDPPAARPASEFRPWSVGEPGEEKPMVPSPFRKRFKRDEAGEGVPSPTPQEAAPVSAPVPELAKPHPASPEVVAPAEAAKPAPTDTPKPAAPKPAAAGPEKTLRMILQELRSQRGSSGEFSYLTIIAVVLQLIAIVCLLGALWMGGAELSLFLRWLGVALMAQLGVIATLMFGK